MKASDFALLSCICFVWGLNIVVTRWVVHEAGVPPLAFAALRFLVLALVLSPFLFPGPMEIMRMFWIAMGMGAAHFAFLFMGLVSSSAGSVAVVSQLGVPFSTLLSVIFLGERIRWRRILGIILSFTGVTIIVWRPGGEDSLAGLLLIAMSALVGAIAAVLMKRIDPMPALRMQAWIALFSAPPLILVSALVEQGQVGLMVSGGWWFVAAVLFAVFLVSIFGHGGFYVLLKRYEVTLLSPLTLMTPLWGLFLAVMFLGEEVGIRQLFGSLLALSGVGIIAVRPNMKSPLAAFGRKLFQ